jgi:hypothetical protein
MHRPNWKKSPKKKMMMTTQARDCEGQIRVRPKGMDEPDHQEREPTHLSSTKENSILLDSGSMLSLFDNPNMVTNIREAKTTLEQATKAGTKTTKQIAEVPGFGMVWYDKTAIANIFGLSDLKKKHRVTFALEKEDAFTVHIQVQPQRTIHL